MIANKGTLIFKLFEASKEGKVLNVSKKVCDKCHSFSPTYNVLVMERIIDCWSFSPTSAIQLLFAFHFIRNLVPKLEYRT